MVSCHEVIRLIRSDDHVNGQRVYKIFLHENFFQMRELCQIQFLFLNRIHEVLCRNQIYSRWGTATKGIGFDLTNVKAQLNNTTTKRVESECLRSVILNLFLLWSHISNLWRPYALGLILSAPALKHCNWLLSFLLMALLLLASLAQTLKVRFDHFLPHCGIKGVISETVSLLRFYLNQHGKPWFGQSVWGYDRVVRNFTVRPAIPK